MWSRQRRVARANVALDRVAVAVLRGAAKVGDRASEPAVGRVAEAKPRVGRHALAATALGEQLVPQRPGRGDAALDGAPPLLAGDRP